MGQRVVIIGAGVAGLACAHALRSAGLAPEIVEKSRAIGGRLATRRTRDGLEYDHGAPAVNASDKAFGDFLAEAARRGDAAPWRGEFVGAPRMRALPDLLAEGQSIRFETEVERIVADGAALRLFLKAGGEIGADIAVVSAPAPQTARLCAAFPGVARPAETAVMTPAWSLMAAFATPLPGPDLLPGARGITGAHRVSSKPGRAAHPDRWVVEASPEWTAPRLEDAREAIAPKLLDLFAGLAGLDQEPIHHVAHRWRYARTSIPIGRPKLQDGPVIAAGDWLLGPDAGNAYASGLAAAGAVLDRL